MCSSPTPLRTLASRKLVNSVSSVRDHSSMHVTDSCSLISDSRDFAKAHAIPFIEASSGGPLSTPFLTLLNLARQRYETSSSISCGDGFSDFVTVAAAKVSRAMRSHRVASPPMTKEVVNIPLRRDLSGNLPAPRHATCLPNASRFLTIRRLRPNPKSRR